MLWVVTVSWAAALVIGAVVIGLCSYQVSWRAARLRGALERLAVLQDELDRLQAALHALRARRAAVASGSVAGVES